MKAIASMTGLCIIILLLITDSVFARHISCCKDEEFDDSLSRTIMLNGIRRESNRATIWVEKDALTAKEIKDVGALVDDGISNIENLLKVDAQSNPNGNIKIQYFISTKIDVSHMYYRNLKDAYEPQIFLPAWRVKKKTAPYLHETAHVIAGNTTPEWLSEGLASYIESYISENVGGYPSHVFDSEGNKGIDRQAYKNLKNVMAKKALQAIARNPTVYQTLSSNDEIQSFRAVAYIFYQSFVKFLIDKTGLEKTMHIYRKNGTQHVIYETTEKNLESWKAEWIQSLNAQT